MTANRFRATIGALTLVVAGLTGCASMNYTEAYQERLVQALPYPFGVTFSATQTFPGQVLCGDYTASDDGGLRYSTRSFVVTPDRALPRPTQRESAIYCSADPTAELFARGGIGGPGADWTRIAAVRDDMRAIAEAIDRYHAAQYFPPRALGNLVDDGFMTDETLLVDPWDRPYAYSPGLSGGTTARYDLATLGRDGEPGGTGPDADIDRSDLALVEHVLRIEGY